MPTLRRVGKHVAQLQARLPQLFCTRRAPRGPNLLPGKAALARVGFLHACNHANFPSWTDSCWLMHCSAGPAELLLSSWPQYICALTCDACNALLGAVPGLQAVCARETAGKVCAGCLEMARAGCLLVPVLTRSAAHSADPCICSPSAQRRRRGD